MPDVVKLRIPFVYPFEFVPASGSKPRKAHVRDVMEASVRSLSSTDAPVAVSFGDQEDFRRRSFDGALHRKVQPTGAIDLPIVSGGALDLPDPAAANRLLFAGVSPPSDARHAGSRDPRPTGAMTIVDDGRDRVVEAISARAAQLLFIDGEAWTRSRAPRFIVGERKEGHWSSYNTESDPRSGYGMAMDRLSDFEDLLARIGDRGGRIDVGHRMPYLFDWDVGNDGEARYNAAYAGVLAIGSAGNCLGRLSSPTIMEIARVAEAKDALWHGDDGDPHAMFEALTGLGGCKDANVTPNLRRHIAIGLDAISVSRDFSPDRLDADDADALTGLGT